MKIEKATALLNAPDVYLKIIGWEMQICEHYTVFQFSRDPVNFILWCINMEQFLQFAHHGWKWLHFVIVKQELSQVAKTSNHLWLKTKTETFVSFKSYTKII